MASGHFSAHWRTAGSSKDGEMRGIVALRITSSKITNGCGQMNRDSCPKSSISAPETASDPE